MKTVVITGANRGIGYEFCRQYKEKGYHVIALCRTKSKDLENLQIKVIDGIDVTDSNSIAKVQKELSGTKIDILINNAGILQLDSLEDLSADSLKQQFEVNAIGPLMISRALLENLYTGSKIVMITSLLGSIADNTSGGYYGYRMSKAALNMAAMTLSRELANQNVIVLTLHPGYVKTDMTNHLGSILPIDSVVGLIKQIDEAKEDGLAHFRGYNNKELPW